jgi:hypothetical protein
LSHKEQHGAMVRPPAATRRSTLRVGEPSISGDGQQRALVRRYPSTVASGEQPDQPAHPIGSGMACHNTVPLPPQLSSQKVNASGGGSAPAAPPPQRWSACALIPPVHPSRITAAPDTRGPWCSKALTMEGHTSWPPAIRAHGLRAAASPCTRRAVRVLACAET